MRQAPVPLPSSADWAGGATIVQTALAGSESKLAGSSSTQAWSLRTRRRKEELRGAALSGVPGAYATESVTGALRARLPSANSASSCRRTSPARSEERRVGEEG